jgi:predicted dehydrogenase
MLGAGMSVRLGIVGMGYWGPNLARNLATLESCELVWCCELDDSQRAHWEPAYPQARFTAEIEDLLGDPDLTAIVIATPGSTHAQLAQRVMEAGKNCFVEKPLAQDVESAQRLARLADERGLVLMVGHLLCYHPGVRQLADLIARGELGRIHYVHSQRLNLGKLREDENALWSLGAHDVSVLLELADGEPVEVSARGEAFMREGVEDVVFAHIRFDSGLVAHLHLSWLDPHKVRRITVVGSERMATLDDMALERKLSIWDNSFASLSDTYGEYITRSGPVHSPMVLNTEPLRLECAHFVECLRTGEQPHTDGAAGVRVVTVLEALQASLDADGAAVPVRVAADSGADRPGIHAGQ